MDIFRISGGIPLSGSVSASGSKNACLPLLAASLLIDGTVGLRRVPNLQDVRTMLHLLEHLGVQVCEDSLLEEGVLALRAPEELLTFDTPYDMVRRMRASICVLGPMLSRYGSATIALPGGCVFGDRPIDLHIKGLEALGASIKMTHGVLHATTQGQRLKGARIALKSEFGSTVLGTIQVMLAAVLAEGTTVIDFAAKEPEVICLAEFLNASGARVYGAGTSHIRIDGVDKLSSCSFSVPADRIEVSTLLAAGAITGGRVKVLNCSPDEVVSVTHMMRASGLSVVEEQNSVEVVSKGPLCPSSIKTSPYPGFPTDMQAQWMALATQFDGQTVVEDTIYPERFMHVSELNRMGAKIRRKGQAAFVEGPVFLEGAEVMASDLRASAALVLAGLIAQGETLIRRVYHLDRGYESLEEKIKLLGGRIERQVDDFNS